MRKAIRTWALAAIMLAISAPAPALSQAVPPPALPTGKLGFADEGDLAGVVVTGPDGSQRIVKLINFAKDAMAILADPRFAPIWPDLLAWTGSDLHRMHDHILQRTREALDSNGGALPTTLRQRQGNWPRHLLALLNHLDALCDAGRCTEAIALAEAESENPDLREEPLDFSQIETKLANLHERTGHPDQSIATLRLAAETITDRGALENIQVNLAAMLAHTGHYQEALGLDDLVEQSFDTDGPDKRGATGLPDSHAYFAAIRACALEGMGQHARAREVLAQIQPDPETPYRRSVRSQTRSLALLCMHDAAGLAVEWAPLVKMAEPASGLMLELQPGSHLPPAERATVVRALALEPLASALAGHARVLAEPYSSAIAWWTRAR